MDGSRLARACAARPVGGAGRRCARARPARPLVRRARHVTKLTLLAMAGAAAAVALLWAVLGTRVAQPRTLPDALLLLLGLELAALPAAAWFSRRLERAADLCSLELTEDSAAFDRA